MANLRNSPTNIKTPKDISEEIIPKRDVWQGDLLSPLLFSIIIDEFLSQINIQGQGGTIIGDITVTAMDFADDIILLEDDPTKMPSHLNNHLYVK